MAVRVGIAGEMLDKSSLQTCSFRASPSTTGGVSLSGMVQGAQLPAPWGRRGGQCLAAQTPCSQSGHLEGIQGGRGMHREGFIPAVCAISKEIYGKYHPWFPGQMLFCFLRAARGVINCYCRESTECFSFNSKDVFNLPVALCKL